MMVIVVMTVVGGNLSSKLTITKVPTRIDRLLDLLDHPQIKIYTPIGVQMDSYLKQSPNPELQELWSRVLKDKGLRNTSELFEPAIMDEISQGQAALFTNKNFMLPALVNHYCTFNRRPYYIGKEDFQSTSLHILYRKGLDQDIAERISQVYMFHKFCHNVELYSQTYSNYTFR